MSAEIGIVSTHAHIKQRAVCRHAARVIQPLVIHQQPVIVLARRRKSFVDQRCKLCLAPVQPTDIARRHRRQMTRPGRRLRRGQLREIRITGPHRHEQRPRRCTRSETYYRGYLGLDHEPRMPGDKDYNRGTLNPKSR